MRSADMKDFAMAWSVTHKAITGRVPDDDVVRFAFSLLSEYQLAEVRTALHRHATHPDKGVYPPKPADIVRLIEGGAEERGAQATQAWVQLVRNYGVYNTVAFDDPHIHRVVQGMGGWIGLNEKLVESEMKWLQRDFEKLYTALPRSGEYPRQLTGIIDAENSRLGHPVRMEPLFIGDEKRARLVWEGGAESEKPRAPGLTRMGDFLRIGRDAEDAR